MIDTASDEAWSDGLETQTRDALAGLSLFAPRGGQLCFKHTASRFGVIAADDLRRGVLRLVDRENDRAITFPNVEALIAAGWAID